MRYLLICLLVLFAGCASNSPMQTTAISDQTGINKLYVRKGMCADEVLSIMGSPYKSESKAADDLMYSIWYYITTPTVLGQGELLPYNFTPFIFKEGLLLGWGEHFYNYIFNIDNERVRGDQEKSKKINEDGEWHSLEQILTPPPPPEKKEPPKTPPPPEKYSWWE